MANTYYIAGQATWPGSFAGSAAAAQNASTPGRAIDIWTWTNAGTIASGDTVVLLGDYPLTLTDTADYAANSVTVTTEMSNGTATDRSDTGAWGRNILWGNNANGTSSIDGIEFVAVGDAGGFNVDMSGNASTNANRQQAALYLQGTPRLISGFKVKASDYNYIQSGGIAATGTDYATDQYENMGILVRGAGGIGLTLEIANNIAAGGTRGTYGIKVDYYCSATPTVNANRTILIHDNESYNWGEAAIEVQGASGINVSGQMPLGNGQRIKVYDNIARDGYWGDVNAGNAARLHGNLMAIYAGTQNGSLIEVYDNELSGECQDALAILTGFALVYGNYIHSLGSEGYVFGDNVPTFGGTGGGSTLSGYASGWDVKTSSSCGLGVKAGLGASYTGTEPDDWLEAGTAAGAYNIDQFRVMFFANIIDDCRTYSISSNGSGGLLAFANEIRTSRGRGIHLNPSVAEACWLANNYIEALVALEAGSNVNAYLFNNIFKGSTWSILENGSSNAIYGANNLLDGSTSGTVSGLVGSISETADYTWGVGPDVGGNCDGGGEWYGLLGARVPRATARDITGRRWTQNRLPIGPRQPH